MRVYTVEYNAQKSFYQAESNRSFELVSDNTPLSVQNVSDVRS